MAGLAILAAGGALAAALGASGELGLRMEVRARPLLAGGTAVSTELELNPRAALQLGESTASLTLVLEPRLLVSSGGDVSPLAGAQLRGDWRPSPALSFSADQRASYGFTDFSSLVGTAQVNTGTQQPTTGTQQPQPIVGRLNYVSSISTGSCDWQLAPHARAAASLSYQLSGGSNPVSRNTLPLQRGPQGTASLSLALSPRDSLVTQITGAQSSFSGGQNGADGRTGLELSLSEGFSRALSATTTARLAVGAGFIQSEDPSQPTVRQFLPVGEAAVTLSPAARLRTNLSLRAAPLFDRVTGSTYERADAGASLAWTTSEQLALGAGAGFGVVVAGAAQQRGDLLGTLDVGATYALTRQWRLALGVRGAWQRQHLVSQQQDPQPASQQQLVLTEIFQWTAFAGVQFSTKETL